jgi:hypothetical protein
VATGDASDTFVFDFIVADSTDLDNGTQGTNYYKVVTVDILNFADPRIATAGEKILAAKIPDEVWALSKEGFRYFGVQSTISAGSTVSINCAISTSRPRTPDNQQVTTSNVGVPT